MPYPLMRTRRLSFIDSDLLYKSVLKGRFDFLTEFRIPWCGEMLFPRRSQRRDKMHPCRDFRYHKGSCGRTDREIFFNNYNV
jgi:hypothetical protein